VADHIRRLPEVNLFLPGLRSWFGYKQEVVSYDRAARAGTPKQTFRKLFAYAWDGITSFSEMPLKLIGFAGLIISFVGFFYAAVLVSIKLLQAFGFFHGLEVMGFTTLAVAVLFMGGIQLLCLGIIGEYIARAYKETKRRPVYIVENVQRSSQSLE
jgi:glycosyltransferase involved in cell wall biosynthesis